jgi:class 3 adenylate cyclase
LVTEPGATCSHSTTRSCDGSSAASAARSATRPATASSRRSTARRAVRDGQAIIGGLDRLGLEARVGVHTGECELHEGKLSGVAVNVGARIAAAADSGEVMVSSAVRDLVSCSGLAFEDRGQQQLKGVPGSWQLYVASREAPDAGSRS